MKRSPYSPSLIGIGLAVASTMVNLPAQRDEWPKDEKPEPVDFGALKTPMPWRGAKPHSHLVLDPYSPGNRKKFKKGRR